MVTKIGVLGVWFKGLGLGLEVKGLGLFKVVTKSLVIGQMLLTYKSMRFT